jgi:radical SAM superfamily enzyme YgiQ (UPF0313 family)
MNSAFLCICPPYPYVSPPAGAAALLGYLETHGIHDFSFLDLRLATPRCYEPTYAATGAFGESFVMDVPDLPLILELLRATDEGTCYIPQSSVWFDRYCFERGISPGYLLSYLRGLDTYFQRVFVRFPDIAFIGFSVWTSNLLATLLAAHHLKKRRHAPFVVAGGPQVTESSASADLALRSGLFDAVVIGEGEETLRLLYTAFRDQGEKPVDNIPGTRYVEPTTGQIKTREKPLLPIASLPLPSFRRMSIDDYQIDDYRTLPFQMSRGCTDKCTFCSEWVFWQRFRLSAAEETAERVVELQKLYGADYIAFTDSLLNGSAERLHAFAEHLLRKRLTIGWGGFMRAAMDTETAKLLRRSGCEEVFIGIESFNDETLALMNKRRTEADNIRALRAFLQEGIFVVAGLIPGFPGDTRAGFVRSAAVMRQLQTDFPGRLRVNTEPFRVSPGQPLYNTLPEVGLVPLPWDKEYLDIAPRYHDITSRIHCRVEGTNQGLERIGRERLVFMICSDALVRTDKFVYDEDEEVAMDSFSFTHLHGGWHLASMKTDAGFTYALIVNDEELRALESMALDNVVTCTHNRRLVRYLGTLARRHVHSPDLRRPPVAFGEWNCRPNLNDRVCLSPFCVIRQLNWQWKKRLLVAHIANGRSGVRHKRENAAIRYVARRPITVAGIIKYMQHSDVARSAERCHAVVNDLCEDGVFVKVDDQGPTGLERSLNAPRAVLVPESHFTVSQT